MRPFCRGGRVTLLLREWGRLESGGGAPSVHGAVGLAGDGLLEVGGLPCSPCAQLGLHLALPWPWCPGAQSLRCKFSKGQAAALLQGRVLHTRSQPAQAPPAPPPFPRLLRLGGPGSEQGALAIFLWSKEITPRTVVMPFRSHPPQGLLICPSLCGFTTFKFTCGPFCGVWEV